MPTLAHLILGHCRPNQLARLVGSIIHPDATIFIHIDQRSRLDEFLRELAPYSSVTFVKNRIPVTWGGYSMVQATLNAITEILSEYPHCDFINLLSESDYPLKSAATIHHFFERHLGRSFMELHFVGSPWWEEAQTKITKYHFVNYNFPGKYVAERLINAVTSKRTIPPDLVFTGRSQWMTLSTEHVKYIVSFVAKNPKIIRFFKHTWGPDEFFFQTILFSSPYRNEIINDNLRYIEWVDGKPSPETLTYKDLDALANSDKLYARKFNSLLDTEILDAIDQLLLNNGDQ